MLLPLLQNYSNQDELTLAFFYRVDDVEEILVNSHNLAAIVCGSIDDLLGSLPASYKPSCSRIH